MKIFYKLDEEKNPVSCDYEDWSAHCVRYPTWAQAEEGHKVAIQWIEDGCPELD